MLRDGLIVFEGDADALRAVDRSVHSGRSCRRFARETSCMPRTRSLAWSELKIGVLTIVAVVITAVTDLHADRGRGFFWQRYTLKTRFANVAGLASGSPVRVAGVEVGTVTGVEFAGEQVDVIFEVNKDDARPDHRQVSVATLGSVSLLGESAVDITAVDERARRFPTGATCRPGRATASDRRRRRAGDGRASSEITGARPGHPRRQGHGRQADDRRAAVRRAAAVRRDGRRRVTDGDSARAAARWEAAERPDDGQRARGVAQEPRGDDAPDQRGRGQPGQAAERRRLRAVADGGDDEPADA